MEKWIKNLPEKYIDGRKILDDFFRGLSDIKSEIELKRKEIIKLEKQYGIVEHELYRIIPVYWTPEEIDIAKRKTKNK